MSRAVESTASCQRLARIGNTLDKADDANTRANIVSWISDNPKILGRLWQLMETEIIWELLGSIDDKHLPRSCTRIALLSATLEKVLINRNSEVPYARLLIKQMKIKDSKVMEKLFVHKFQFDKKYPLKSGLTYKNLFDVTDLRDNLLGNRLSKVIVDVDGVVDFNKYGNFCFVKAVGANGSLLPIAEPEDFKTATHVFHRHAKFGVTLATLGCPTPNEDFVFIDNHDEHLTQISNGLRMRIALWDDFKTQPYFNYADRFATAWGSNTWESLVGEKITMLRDEAKAQIHEREDEIKKLRTKAVADGVQPKRRRRL
jgi:hypothetical protein